MILTSTWANDILTLLELILRLLHPVISCQAFAYVLCISDQMISMLVLADKIIKNHHYQIYMSFLHVARGIRFLDPLIHKITMGISPAMDNGTVATWFTARVESLGFPRLRCTWHVLWIFCIYFNHEQPTKMWLGSQTIKRAFSSIWWHLSSLTWPQGYFITFMICCMTVECMTDVFRYGAQWHESMAWPLRARDLRCPWQGVDLRPLVVGSPLVGCEMCCLMLLNGFVHTRRGGVASAALRAERKKVLVNVG